MAGATFDIVVLSSSPPEPSAAPPRVAMLPSSPPRFSPPMSPLRPTVGAPRTNFRAAPIPERAVRGFATVGTLVQSEYFVQPPEDVTPAIQQAQSPRASRGSIGAETVPTKKPRKRASKTTAAGDELEKPKRKPRARKPKIDKDTPAADPELRLPAPKKSPFFIHGTTETTTNPLEEAAPKLTKAGTPRKPRAKKETVEGEGVDSVAKPKRTRVTKAKGTARDGKAQREDAPVTSAHFRDAAGQTIEQPEHAPVQAQDPVPDDLSIWDVPQSPRPKKKKAAPKPKQADPLAQGLDLEEAVTRRRDWTPPRDTAISTPFTDSVGKENTQLGPPNADGTFTSLVSNFAYAQSPSVQITATSTSTSTKEKMPVTKRHRVELVDIPGHQTNSRNSSPEKGKAPKKKPRTITDIATEQYAPKEPSPNPNAVTSNFFDARSTTTKVPLNDLPILDGGAPLKKPPRRRNSSKSDSEKIGAVKPKRVPKKSAAKSKPVAEKLLSPTSALLRLSRQDVLFGTSSQLALEESPTMVRHLQQAMRESERDAGLLDDPFIAAPPRWPKLARSVGRRGLWAESARDADGGVLEHMEDVYIPEPDRTQEIPLLMDGTHDNPDTSEPFIDIDDIEPLPRDAPPSALPAPPRIISQASQNSKAHDVDYPMINDVLDIDTYEQEPPPSNQNADSQHSFADIDDFSPPPTTRFRASAPPQIPPSTPMSLDTTPKKRRGRPPKSKAAIPTVKLSSTPKLNPSASIHQTHPPSTPPASTPRFIDIEEILDSEDEAFSPLSPTPPRVQQLADLPPLPLASFDGSPMKPTRPLAPDPTLAQVHKIPSTHLEWANIKSTVFPKLTAHIRSIPPTTDPKKPSWHEKILLFDPIILEDFTAYLNSHTPIRVYKRATQKQIKAWNADAKKRGGVGVGGVGDGEVLAVEKELEGFMVKAWCEGLSVCCINRVRGNGGARKGFY